MKYESDEFRARGLSGGHYLVTNSGTLEGVREEIDRANERAVKLGYKAEQWIITHTEWYSFYDDNGLFSRSETYEQAIEVYPPKAE